MSLDDLRLPPYLIQKMYSACLVETEPAKPKKKAQKETVVSENISGLQFSGGNARHIFIGVHEPGLPLLSDDNTALLVGILNACRLSMNDVALVNFPEANESAQSDITETCTPQILLFFGIEPAALGFPLQLRKYTLTRYADRQFVYASGLAELANNKDEKKKLWTLLREVFNVA